MGGETLEHASHPQSELAAETSGSELGERGVQLGALAGQTLNFGVHHGIITRHHLVKSHFHQADLDQKIVVDRNRIHSKYSHLSIHDEPRSLLSVAWSSKQNVCQVTIEGKSQDHWFGAFGLTHLVVS